MPRSMPTELLIYLYLQKEGRKSRQEISTALGIHETTVTHAFNKLKELGVQKQLHSPPRTLWQLLSTLT